MSTCLETLRELSERRPPGRRGPPAGTAAPASPETDTQKTIGDVLWIQMCIRAENFWQNVPKNEIYYKERHR